MTVFYFTAPDFACKKAIIQGTRIWPSAFACGPGPPLSCILERPRASGWPGRLPAATARLGPPGETIAHYHAIRPLGGGSQSGGEMRRCVLCGRWARLAFPRAREKKKKKAIGNSFTPLHSQKYCSPRALLLPVTAECCCWCCCSPPSRGRICPRRAEHSPTVSVASIFAAAAAPEHGSTACK